MEQEKDIDRIKGEKTVDMLMARIVHELNAIDDRFRFYMESRSCVFVADYYRLDLLPALRRAIKVESSRLSVMYSPRWISEPYRLGARSFFDVVRRTHPVDMNEMKPMHIAPNIYWRRILIKAMSTQSVSENELKYGLTVLSKRVIKNDTFQATRNTHIR